MNAPKLTETQAEDLAELFQHTANLVIRRNGWGRNCLSCINFDEKTELCALANARPPAKIIVEACPQWDNIPF